MNNVKPSRYYYYFFQITVGFMTALIEKISSNKIFKDEPKIALYILVTALTVAVLVLRFKYGFIVSIWELLCHKKP